MLLARYSDLLPEAGVDEAGRGCLAGPVVAAAVIFPNHYENPLLNDSKKLTPARREELEVQIKKDALAWAVSEVSHAKIDEINILNATYLAMHQALDQLVFRPAFIIIDGNRFKAYGETAHQCIVKGDGKYLSIAAASILAKTHRDALMRRLAEEFPGYGWERNMGYGTEEHRKAIHTIGFSPYHRRTFSVGNPQLKLF